MQKKIFIFLSQYVSGYRIKENIGLIEVMELVVLPARLKSEMERLEEALLEGKDIRAIKSMSKPDVGRNKRNRSWYCAVDI